MNIHLENVGKKFSREWLFRELNAVFEHGKRYAITGPNGSGKSTLIQLLAGNQLCSEGTISYSSENHSIPVEEVFQDLSITAPYLELIEEFTLEEAIDFHFQFKALRTGFSKKDLIEIGLFSMSRKKYIRNFSSGMKQRLKLLLAFYSDTSLLLLDEPTTNLDDQGIKWYHDHINLLNDTLILVASNQPYEYTFCDLTYSLDNFKPR